MKTTDTPLGEACVQCGRLNPSSDHRCDVPEGLRGDGSSDDLAAIQEHITMNATRPR